MLAAKTSSLYCTFTAKSVGKRIVKIGQHLAKFAAKIKWHLFPEHAVYALYTILQSILIQHILYIHVQRF